jgi:multiple sugar transport system permease protein
VVPPQLINIPMYLNFRFFDIFGLLPKTINLLGTHWPFILTAITGTGLRNGFFIYIMRQCFKGMPQELEDAAYVDGAGPFTTFWRVMLPGAGNSLLIVFLFSFVWQWNDIFLSTLYLGGSLEYLPFALQDISQILYEGRREFLVTFQYASLLNNAGMLMFIAPLLIIYAVLQRYFIESIERTGITGF